MESITGIKRFKNVDFLRFVFALMIVVFHINGFESCYQEIFSGITHWYLCVDFFFIIAGFFLFNYINQNMSTLQYAVKRFFRLAPLVWLYIILAIISCLCLGKAIHFDGYILKIFLLSNLGFSPEADTKIHWFIPVLFWCSLFYFYVSKILDKKFLNILVWLLIICGYGLALNSAEYGLDVHTNNVFLFINTGVVRGLAGMGIGYFVSLLYKTDFLKDCSKVVTYIVSSAEIAVVSIFGYFMLFSKELPCKLTFPLILFFTILFFLFIRNKGVIAGVLNNRFSVVLGSWSYAIYVLSPAVNKTYINFMTKHYQQYLTDKPLLTFGLLIFIDIVFGVIAHYAFEKPVNKFVGKKLSGRAL